MNTWLGEHLHDREEQLKSANVVLNAHEKGAILTLKDGGHSKGGSFCVQAEQGSFLGAEHDD